MYDHIFGKPLSNPDATPESHIFWYCVVVGFVGAFVPGAFAVGTASEYLSGTSDVPMIVPVICISLSVASVIGSMKFYKVAMKKCKKTRMQRQGLSR